MNIQNKVPKYIQLISQIKSWVISGKMEPGQQIPTEHELAQQFNISRHTVRQAIHELVHEKWLYKEQGKGTFFCPTLPGHQPENSSQSHMIGVVTTYISDYIFPSIIRGIESYLTPKGYSILLLSTNNDFAQEAKALEIIMNKQVDGLIIEPTKSTYPNPNLEYYLSLLGKRIPFLMLHASYEELGCTTIKVDDERGGKLAANHLINLGYRRIGAIFKSDDLQGKYRLKGFLNALQENSLTFYSDLISLYTTEQKDLVSKKYADFICTKPVEQRPDAIVCYNDEIAIQLIQQLKNYEIRVPDDISIVGFDDSKLATISDVQLTTISHPKFEMGMKAAETILHLIQNADITTNHSMDYTFEPELIVRNTTKNK
ncbi:GntR family transcriptional regulator [Fodinisporobacter ferrooxydans]|uniref:GntR family transcriptional regulator n=1 Tax=Fodinisporobacter ferrooxydans TaxID=2901836 RepID=A0ABY4CL57_9BACL|nr:GntR family transcriptional regulator [Alicyclobacillaceae bacterium MYW30-H2]